MVNTDTPTQESRTRDRVLRVVSQQGPVSIAALTTVLGVTETAVRRHVDSLHTDGLVEPREVGGPRRRGRPAKAWVVSSAGHRALSADYDDLAGEALRFLRRTAGPDAVQAFAEERMAGLEQRIAEELATSPDDPAERAEALVRALTAEGYSASARPVGTPDAPHALTGVQLCQGHCPVQHVASEFPELCEAETEAFSRLLGVHVQRLATLAHGDHVCTTFVPTPTTERPSR
ncbi:HTH domain-containing protein [Phycicoccus sp. BSK3Z-2]|uniref:HTH domain-containing protein n=1 Tax=Phycicoccus avicenniae TaxID=2828860 RepID=A0A941D7H9_9MICO|nr:MarR family transcriptional regulator [Phycicoccus avicenniae]MBR7742230.1 HTH domain-containing protein [Phycicoccus avicenniae]